jgi:hypothetical protein
LTRGCRVGSNQVANLAGKRVSTVRPGEIGRNRIGLAACRADLVDHGLRLVGVAAVVDDDAGAGGGECQGGGAAHAAGRAGDESDFVGEVGHDGVLLCRASDAYGHQLEVPKWCLERRITKTLFARTMPVRYG